jgi:O-antigen/teichoic acid export membrane protein
LSAPPSIDAKVAARRDANGANAGRPGAWRGRGVSAAGPLSLRGNFSWTFCGTALYSASSWAMLAVIAKLGTAQMLGQYALGLAVAQPVMVLSQLHLRAVQATDSRRQFAFGDYLALRLLTTSLAVALIAAIAWLAGYRGETALVIVVSGVSIGFDAVSDVFYGLLQQHERMDRIAISMVAKGVLSLAGLSLGLWTSGSVLGAAVGSALASAIVLAAYDVPSAGWLARACGADAIGSAHGPAVSARPLWHAGELRRLAWLALPMGVTTALNSLGVNLTRYLIVGFLGQAELGVFAAAASILGIGRTFIGALGQAASPRLARDFATGRRREFRVNLLRLVLLAAGLGVAGLAASVIAGRQVLTLFFSAEYARHVDVFFWLMASGVATYLTSALGIGLTAARRFRIQVPLSLSAIVTSALAGWWLIPAAGLRGAAWSAFLAAAAQLLFVFAATLPVVRDRRREGARGDRRAPAWPAREVA